MRAASQPPFIVFLISNLLIFLKIIFSNVIYGAMKANVTDEVNKIKFIDIDYCEKFAYVRTRWERAHDREWKVTRMENKTIKHLTDYTKFPWLLFVDNRRIIFALFAIEATFSCEKVTKKMKRWDEEETRILQFSIMFML